MSSDLHLHQKKLTDAERDALEEAIYERSKTEALAAHIGDYIGDDGGTYWVAAGTRGQAMAFAAWEFFDGDFIRVRARRVYMAVDLQAIRDRAHDLACDAQQGYTVREDEVAYTWEDYGWLWSVVPKDHPRAVPLWECTEVAR